MSKKKQNIEAKRIVEYQMNDGGAILLEVDELEGTPRISRGPSEISKQAKELFEQVLSIIHPQVRK